MTERETGIDRGAESNTETTKYIQGWRLEIGTERCREREGRERCR